MEDIRIIIMTKSSKFSENCVAGIDVSNGKWVRLVSDNKQKHGAIADKNLRCSSGNLCSILDVIKAPIKEKCGDEIQPENVLLDTAQYIEIEGKVTLNQVLKIHPAEIKYDILGNIYPYITNKKVAKVGYSLILVEVEKLIILHEKNSLGKYKTKCNFKYRGIDYQNMCITDPKFYSIDSGTKYDKAFLVISIGTSYEDRYYKFVSSIFIV